MDEINPLEIEKFAKLLSKDTFSKYSKSWKNFVVEKKITIGKPPCKEDFESFFETRRENGLAGTTIRSLYSHLNRMYQLVSIFHARNKQVTFFIIIFSIGLWQTNWRFCRLSFAKVGGIIC